MTDFAYFYSRQFPYLAGAPSDVSKDNTDDVQAAIGDAAQIRVPLAFPGGSIDVKARSNSPFTFGNTPFGTYPALMLNASNVWFTGPSILHIRGRANPTINDIQPLIATNKNLVIDTLKNVGFRDIAFDTNNDGDAANSNQRGPYLMGIQGLKFWNTGALSSGARRGSAMYLHNNKNVQIGGHRHEKVTSGGNYRYNVNLVIANAIYDNFSEAIDLDGINWQVIVSDVIFNSIDRTSQSIDCNSVVNGVFSGLISKLNGQLININHKYTTPPTFTDYVNGVVSTATPSQRIVVANAVGEQVGAELAPLISIGGQWAANPHPGTPCEHEIILQNFLFEDCGYFAVNEVTGLILDNFYMGNVAVPADASALFLSSDANDDNQIAGSDLDAVIKYGTVKTSQRGMFRAKQPRRIVIDHLRGSDLQTLGAGEHDIHITNLEKRGAYVEIDGIDIAGNVVILGDSTAISAWAGTTTYPKNKIVSNSGRYYRCITGGISTGAGGPTTTEAKITDGTCVWEWMPEPYTIVWGKRNQMRGTLILQGDAHKFIHGENVLCHLPDIAATGTIVRSLYTARRRCTLVRAYLTVAAAVAASGSNYRTINIKSKRAGGVTTIRTFDTQAGLTAHIPLDAGMVVNPSGVALESGDTIFLDLPAAIGTGAALIGALMQLEVLEH